MSQHTLRTLLTTAAMAALLIALEPAAPAQTPEEQQRALSESIRQLQMQISELRQSVMEIRAEATQYREEAAKLRSELDATRSQLAGAPAPSAESAAQQAPPASSVKERVSQLEEDVQLLDGKVKEQAQTKIESASKYRVRLYGIALVNLFGNSGSVDSVDLPTLATRRESSYPAGSFGGTLRQSTLGLQVFGPEIAGAKTSGDIQFDFGGGFPLVPNGVTMGVVRLRTATLRADWTDTALVGGQDSLFFAPLAPTSFASIAVPALAYSGKLWSWTPQLRVEKRVALSTNSEVSIKVGILDSLTGETPALQYTRQPTAGEASGQPAYAAHFSWNRKVGDRTTTVGAGGYYGRQNWGFGRNVDSWAGVVDWDLPLGHSLALSGEVYRGRAIGGLGAATGRSVVFSGPSQDPASSLVGVNAVGGWTQLKFMPAPRIEFNAAIGEDYPFSRDVLRFPQNIGYANELTLRNQQGFVNVIARPRSDLVVSLEYRHLRTTDVTHRVDSANHINLSMGVLF